MLHLPSGLQVELDIHEALDAIAAGSMAMRIGFVTMVNSAEDIPPLIDLQYYKNKGDGRSAHAYDSGYTLADFRNNRCGWSKEDTRTFQQWLTTPAAQGWMQEKHQELVAAISANPIKLPQGMETIFDGDD